ncbi:class I poly(R)-hydroxyalkanoic acid synthase [Thioclava sp. SK-1]|uniref:class I poly(R)-hydroxyalkanoic acid synthase n=1 Tax=Thioclava sp. SK-1 TaxID=1889770 RepID=UPI000826B540|nr:class I poly(R)-hydroxyalkanoic acid synthase [Thioclava sp. SK-1]OCX64644.1 class I poly(R)-hydroxyalkanoic acid synthase [Thioclava sp. SK-1]
MTTGEEEVSAASQKMQRNLEKIEALTQRMVDAMTRKRAPNLALEGPGPDLYMSTANAYMRELADKPSHIFESQVKYWGEAITHYMEASHTLATEGLKVPEDTGPKDRRFTNPLWDTHPYFNFVKQQYMIASKALDDASKGLPGLTQKDQQRVDFFTHQLIDMMAPTNFLATNPDALERAVVTEGESLVQGLENLVRDMEQNDGDLLVTLADRTAFDVGTNLGASEGAVVYRTRMFELIQYAPLTEQVHRTPLLIFPPWINKFYILDMKAQSSFIKFAVEQGFTVFVVSWKNPDATFADVGFEDYLESYLDAMTQVKAITKVAKINVIGYCIAGTTLSLALALMNKRKDTSVNCATFFTTLTNFSEQGEFIPFLQDDFVDGLERQCERDGVLSSYFMSRTFSFLRSNDLIWKPAIRSYMMGEAPPAFDLLYWNGDATNLPGKMAMQYLRGLCQENHFAEDGYEILGEVLKLSDVKVPLMAVACETDHIAPWITSFSGIAKMGSKDKTFILSESGHIAGIVNPPSKKKYGHYTSPAPLEDAKDWKSKAEFHDGSWWPRWQEWLASQSGRMVAAREPGGPDHPVLAEAPGIYVKEIVKI